MTSTLDPAPVQTPAQWAVRWHGLMIAAVLAASVPVLHVGWHVVLGHREPLLATRTQVECPSTRWRAMTNGTWQKAIERHLREASPVVWWLRSAWNELLLRAGISQSDLVHVGSEHWLYLRADVEADAKVFAARALLRQQAFRAVHDRVRAAGCDLLVAVVPDKSRIHCEHAWSDGVVAPNKAPLYDIVQRELRDAGIPTVDLAQAMRAARAAAPDRDLFYRGDTHWSPPGALVVANAIAEAVDGSAVGARLGPRIPMRIGAASVIHSIGDLAGMLGIATFEVSGAGGRLGTVGLSALSQRFREAREYYAVEPVPGGHDAAQFDGKWRDAEVVLVGTSFALENGLQALMLALGRPVRLVQESGAASLRPMRRLLGELAEPGRPRPKLVVWEIVERGLLEGDWGEPKLEGP